MNAIEAISRATVEQAEGVVFDKMKAFFAESAARCGESEPYLRDEAIQVMTKGIVRMVLEQLAAGLDVALASRSSEGVDE